MKKCNLVCFEWFKIRDDCREKSRILSETLQILTGNSRISPYFCEFFRPSNFPHTKISKSRDRWRVKSRFIEFGGVWFQILISNFNLQGIRANLLGSILRHEEWRAFSIFRYVIHHDTSVLFSRNTSLKQPYLTPKSKACSPSEFSFVQLVSGLVSSHRGQWQWWHPSILGSRLCSSPVALMALVSK